MEKPIPKKGIYKHYKGNYYRLLHIAAHSETTELVVVYQAMYDDSIWVRPLDMWDETVTTPDGEEKRFTFISE